MSGPNNHLLELNGVSMLRRRWSKRPDSFKTAVINPLKGIHAPYEEFWPLRDVSFEGMMALVQGENVLSVGVWNSGAPDSTDPDLINVLDLEVISPGDDVHYPFTGPGTNYTDLATNTSRAAVAARSRMTTRWSSPTRPCRV